MKTVLPVFRRNIMTLRTRTHLLFLAAAIALAACLSGAQQHAATVPAQAQAAAQALSEPMPLDPQITMGKFPNGMRYYIRSNKKPEKRAELRLVVKAGSILEDDDRSEEHTSELQSRQYLVCRLLLE